MSDQRRIPAQVAVVGGGIIGAAIAYYLSKRSADIVLLDKGALGAEASGHNSGGVRQQCRNTAERPLAMASVKLWETLDENLGFDTEYVQGGNIRMAINEEHMSVLERQGQEELDAGLPIEIWNRDQLRQYAPYLNDIFVGAKFCPSDGHANPLIAARAFGWAARRLGGTVLPYADVTGIRTNAGHVIGLMARSKDVEIVVEAPIVIIACGAWAPALCKPLEIDLPIEPVRHVIAVTEQIRPFFTQYIQSALYTGPEKTTQDMSAKLEDLGQLGIRPARDGHIHIGGVGTPGTFDQTASANAVRQLARDSVRMIPSLRDVRLLRAWGRTIQLVPDELPIIGPVDEIGGLILAVGFSGHGFCLGPIVGKLLSELIMDGAPSMSMEAFRFDRFTNGVSNVRSSIYAWTG